MAVYLALFTGLFAVAQRSLCVRFGAPGLLAAPVLWTAMEYLQSVGELGFPWLLLGHSQAPWPAVVQYRRAHRRLRRLLRRGPGQRPRGPGPDLRGPGPLPGPGRRRRRARPGGAAGGSRPRRRRWTGPARRRRAEQPRPGEVAAGRARGQLRLPGLPQPPGGPPRADRLAGDRPSPATSTGGPTAGGGCRPWPTTWGRRSSPAPPAPTRPPASPSTPPSCSPRGRSRCRPTPRCTSCPSGSAPPCATTCPWCAASTGRR